MAAAVLTAVISAAGLANDFLYDVNSGAEPPFAVLDPLDVLGQSLQLAVIIAGAGLMLLITAEYSTGAVITTFTAQPRRGVVLGAKAAVGALLGAVTGTVSGGAAMAVTSITLGEHAAPGGPGVGEFAVRVGLLWAALAVFTVALGALLRSAVGTLAALVVILLGSLAIPDAVGRFLPGQAALAFLSASASPYPPGVGLALVAGWAAVALVTANYVQARRDV